MTENEYRFLTHNLNKSIGEWEFRFDNKRIEELPVYQMSLLFLNSFVWARFGDATLEAVNYKKEVASLKDLHETNIQKDLSFATINFTGLYFVPDDSEFSEHWIKSSYRLDFYNEKDQKNHPFIALRVYPRLYKNEIILNERKVNIGESSRLNQERFNQQFNRLQVALNAKVDVCGSELGYRISDKGITEQQYS